MASSFSINLSGPPLQILFEDASSTVPSPLKDSGSADISGPDTVYDVELDIDISTIDEITAASIDEQIDFGLFTSPNITSFDGDFLTLDNVQFFIAAYEIDDLSELLGLVQPLDAGEAITVDATAIVTNNSGVEVGSVKVFEIVINGENDAPVTADDILTLTEEEAKTFSGLNVLDNDTDIENQDLWILGLDRSAWSWPAEFGGTADAKTENFGGGGFESVVFSSDLAELTLAADGEVSLSEGGVAGGFDALSAGQSWFVEADHIVEDSRGATSVSTFALTITGENDAPEAQPQTVSVDADGPTVATGSFLSGLVDPDVADDADVSSVEGETDGAVDGVAGTLVWDAETGAFTYTLDPADEDVLPLQDGETLIETFAFVVEDEEGATDTETLTVTVTGRDDPPVANDDMLVLTEEEAKTFDGINILDNDVDPETGRPTAAFFTDIFQDQDPENQYFITSLSEIDADRTVSKYRFTLGTIADREEDDFVLEIDQTGFVTTRVLGDIDRLPADYEAVASVVYEIEDASGATDTATFSFKLLGLEDDPDAQDQFADVDAAGPLVATGSLLDGLVEDDGDVVEVSSVAGDGTGEVAGVAGILEWDAETGGFTYTLDPDDPDVKALGEDETLADAFEFTVEDEAGASDVATLTVTVTGVDDPPTAADDVLVPGPFSSWARGNVLSNDEDPDGEGLEVTDVEGAVRAPDGTFFLFEQFYGLVRIRPDGTVDFKGLGFGLPFGPLEIDYEASDPNGNTASATLTIAEEPLDLFDGFRSLFGRWDLLDLFG